MPSSRRATRATVVSSFASSIECRKTLRIVPSKVLMLSMKTTSFAPRNSRKRPGVMNASSSRDSSWRSNSSFRCSAQGDRNSDRAMIATRNGAANSMIGRRSAVSDCPEVCQTIISLSRYQRESVSSTVRKIATASRMLSRASALKPSSARMPSGATAPPAACASRRNTRLVNRMAARIRKSPIAVAVSSRVSARRKIMTPGKVLTFSPSFADNARNAS